MSICEINLGLTKGQIVSANVRNHPHCVSRDLQQLHNNDEAVLLLFLMCLQPEVIINHESCFNIISSSRTKSIVIITALR